MSDYDDDELPPISVNISDADSSKFSIPDADILASQRAEEAAREEQIRLLRAAAAAAEAGNEGSQPSRTDSSGSEGEAVLAKTLVSLRMEAPVLAVTHPRPAALLAAFLPAVPGNNEFLTDLLHMLEEVGDDGADKVTDALVENVCELLQSESSWSDEDMLQVCLALMSVSVGKRRRDAVAALRQLLDHVASAHQVELITSVVISSLSSTEAGAGAGAGPGAGGTGWRGAAGRGGDRLADLLAGEQLRRILTRDNDVQEGSGRPLLALVTSSWRRLDARAQHTAVALLGRVLRGREGEGEILAAAAQLTAQATDRNHPDRLKVMVGVSKLQLLLRPTR